MQIGDKVLALLAAKLLCCGLLVLGPAAGLASVLGWLTERSVMWTVAALLVAAMAVMIWRGRSAPRFCC